MYLRTFIHTTASGVSYKSGQPPAMMIDKGSKQNWKDDVGSADTAPSVDEIKKALGGAKASSSTNSNSNSSSNIPNKPTQGKGGATKAQAPAVVPSAPVSSKSQVKTGPFINTCTSRKRFCIITTLTHIQEPLQNHR